MGFCDLWSLFPQFVLYYAYLFCTGKLSFLEFIRSVVVSSACLGIYFPWMFAIGPCFTLAYLLRSYVVLYWTFCILGIVSLLLLGYDYLQSSLLVTAERNLPAPRGATDFDLIMSRRSIRSYQRRRLSDGHREQLLAYLAEANQETAQSSVRLVYVPEEFAALLITGATEFIVAIMPKGFTSMNVLDIGRYLEKVIHKLTRLGVATCWIGGFQGAAVGPKIPDFDPSTDHIACLCAVGYESKNMPMVVKYLQMPYSRVRFPMGHFFRDGNMLSVVECMNGKAGEAVRWGPSASNEQGTRIVRCRFLREDDDCVVYHFYKSTPSMYYAKLGVGISMTNWELTCAENGLTGRWVVDEGDLGSRDIEIPSSNTEYMISWVPTQSERTE